ncbi:unnamed protein product, partial [Staurois parvus]
CAVGTRLSKSGAHSLSNLGARSPSLPKGPQCLVMPCTVCSLWSSVLSAVSVHLLYCPQSLVIPYTVPRSLWSSPVLSPQSLVISCTVSAVSGHLLYCVRSLWSSPVLCPQSLVISCTVSAVSGPSPVLCPQSLVISCTVCSL